MRASGSPEGFLGAVPVKSPGLLYGHTHTLGTFSTQISGIYASPHKNFPWLRCPRGKTILFFTHSRISWLREQWLRKPYKESGIVQMSTRLSRAEADPTPLKLLSGTGLSDGLWGDEGWQALHVVMNAPELEHWCRDICILKQAGQFRDFWAAGVNFRGKT